MGASELAQMGVCERRVRFSAQLGARPSEQQRRAAARGARVHARFLRDAMTVSRGVETSERTRGRCFIATAVYGEGAETQALRRFRDQVLRPSRLGRRLIVAYYRIAPRVCVLLARAGWAPAVARVVLRPAVAAAKVVTRQAASRADR